MKIGFLRVLLIVLVVAVMWSTPSSGLSQDATGTGSPAGRIRLLEDSDYFPTLLDAIDRATSEIVMVYFLFKTTGYEGNYTDRIVTHLIGAAERGIQVSVILERSKEARSMVDRNNEETAQRLKKGKIRVVFDTPRTTTHTKTAVIDRRFVFLGSHNLTNSALKYNHELSLLADSPSLAEEVLDYIDGIK